MQVVPARLPPLRAAGTVRPAARPSGGACFVDRQVYGPYRLWRHTHEFTAYPHATLTRDSVRCELPFGRLGTLTHAAIVRRDLDRVFDYRRQRVARLFPETGMQSEV